MSITVYFRISEIKDNDFGGTIQVREIQFADSAFTVWPVTAASAVGGTIDSGTLANSFDGNQTTFVRWYTGGYPTSVTYSVTAPDGTTLTDAQAANIHQKDTGFMNCRVEFSTDNATWTTIYLGDLAGGTSTAYGSWTDMTATPDINVWVKFTDLAPISGTTISIKELAPCTASGELQHQESVFPTEFDVYPNTYSIYFLDDLTVSDYQFVDWADTFPTYITQHYRMPFGAVLSDIVSFLQGSGDDINTQLGTCTVSASMDGVTWTHGFTGTPNAAADPNTFAATTPLDFAGGPTTISGDASAQATATGDLRFDERVAGAAADQATASAALSKTDTLGGAAVDRPLAWAEADKTATLSGAATDQASAQATFPSAQALAGGATDDAEASGSLASGRYWTARCIIAGLDISPQIESTATVDAEEGAARVATVVLQPPSGTVAPMDYVGKAISLDYIPSGGSGIPQRLFTGKVDTPSYDPTTTLLTLACVDDLQNRVAAMDLEDIDTLVGGRYSPAISVSGNALVSGEPVAAIHGQITLLAYDPDLTMPATVEDVNGTIVYVAGTDYVMEPHGIKVQGSTILAPVDGAPNIRVTYSKSIALDHWEYAKARLSTVMASLDGNAQGVLRLTAWQGLGLYATYTEADLLYDHSTVTFPQASTLINRVDVSYTYRYPRLRQRVGSLSWSGQQSDMKLNGYVYPTADELIGAAHGTGWQVTFQMFTNAPAEIPHPSKGVVRPREGAIDLAIFKLEQRHSQTVDEAYAVIVRAPESIALHGEIEQTLSGALESRFPADVWEKNLSMPPDLSSLGEEDWAPDVPRETSDYALQTLLDMAKVKIIGSHRSGRIGNAVPLNPLLDLDKRIAINTPEMQADGKVVRVVHTMNFDSGSAITEFDLAIVSAGGAGIITPTVLDPPPRPPAAAGVQPWQAQLPVMNTSCYGHTPYQESLMGLLLDPLKSYTVYDVPQTVPPFGFEDISFDNPYYVEGAYPVTGFRIQMPGVDGIDRNPITLAKAASYDVRITPDLLTFMVP